MVKTILQQAKNKKQTEKLMASDIRRKKQIILTKAFGFAFYGIFWFLKKERNGKIQMAVAVLIIICGTVLQISTSEWLVILLCIAIVLSLEMLNSAIEKLCDFIFEEYHPSIKIIKDVSAGAVLWTSLISAIIGAIIFLPKIVILCFLK